MTYYDYWHDWLKEEEKKIKTRFTTDWSRVLFFFFLFFFFFYIIRNRVNVDITNQSYFSLLVGVKFNKFF